MNSGKTKPPGISHYTVTTALGHGNDSNFHALREAKSGLKPCRFYDIKDLDTWVGQIEDIEDITLPSALQEFSCRNNKLALLGLEQDDFLSNAQAAIRKYGSNRVGVFIGTSTSGILQAERAYIESSDLTRLPDWFNYSGSQNIYSVAEFVRRCIGAGGPCFSISTACSSSAKVFGSAWRAMQSGFCDAAIIGGVDSLCLTTLYGFHSLQLMSNDVCRPSDVNRSGISIGEAAGYALLEFPDMGAEHHLLGYGESSDAYHMSSPHPEGQGAFLAMDSAIKHAGLSASDIDYITLHGTATLSNDITEARAVNRLFGSDTPCNSTKGWTGHTLGAAGIVGAVFALLCIENSFVPLSLNTRKVDPEININIITKSFSQSVGKVLVNSFGFGGSNCSLVLGSDHE